MNHNKLLTAAIVSCILTVAGFTYITYIGLKHTTTLTSANQTTLTVLKYLEKAYTDITDYNKARARYVLAGDRRLLDSCENLSAAYHRNMEKVNAAHVSDPFESDQIRQFASISDKLLQAGMPTPDSAQTFSAQTNAFYRRQFMIADSLESKLDIIEGLERINLNNFERAKLQSAQFTFNFVFAFSLLAVVVFIVFSYLIKKNIDERLIAQQRLTDANKSLEAFTYLVSHDLKSPAKNILAFSQIISAGYSDQFDDELKELFGSIESTSLRMYGIIEDTLTLAKNDREELQSEAVDLNQIVNEVWRGISDRTQNKAALKVCALPIVKGSRNMLQQVIHNLLFNAVKYSAQKPSPAIEIGCKESGNMATIFIKDNGAGFDMKYYGKLFGAFQRLHSMSEFEGTGLGLVIAKKIIEKHGGRIWAESQLNEGATFYFTLPLA